MAPLLNTDEIHALIDAALAVGLVDSNRRALWMAGIDPRLWQRFPTHDRPVDQLTSDLHQLAEIRSLARDGTAPLLVWLRNAARAAEFRVQAADFESAYQKVQRRLEPDSPTTAAAPTVERAPTTAAPRSAGQRTTHDGHAVIASWVHLSDIHFGHGDPTHRSDQRLILDALKRELKGKPPGDVPPPDMMLITGDVAFSGAALGADEYSTALDELTAAAAACGVPLEQVYAVAGNHDVNGKATTKLGDKLAFDSYRNGRAVDEALGDTDMRALFETRQANYLGFTGSLAADCRALYWKAIVATSDRPLRLVGLNTALLADVRDDHGKLQIGNRQLQDTLLGVDDEELVIVLTHHPLHGGWLRDEKNAKRFLHSRAHVHLCGHVHDAGTVGVQSGGGQVLVTIAAGATHDEAYPGAGHGFNYAALLKKADGTYWVRVWPRRFAPKQFGFVVDPDGVADGRAWADHRLQS